jgi:ABC-type lipoprotein release transport system permease subunit
MYRPLPLDDHSWIVLIARARTDPARLLAPMRAAARAEDQRVFAEAWTMLSGFERKIKGPRLASTIAACTALLALLLSCLGIYGVVACGSSLRSKELGIRVALGANRPSLARLLLRQLASPAASGAAIGLTAAFAVGRILSGEPFYLPAVDPVVNLSVVGLLALFGGAAAMAPIVKALRADALQALRYE